MSNRNTTYYDLYKSIMSYMYNGCSSWMLKTKVLLQFRPIMCIVVVETVNNIAMWREILQTISSVSLDIHLWVVIYINKCNYLFKQIIYLLFCYDKIFSSIEPFRSSVLQNLKRYVLLKYHRIQLDKVDLPNEADVIFFWTRV